MEVPYIIFYIIIGGFLGAASVGAFSHFLPKEKKNDPPLDLQGQINSLRAAHHEFVLALGQKSPAKISRIDNKELFDRIEALEKAEKTTVIRHEHYYVELPKGKKPKDNPLGKGVTALFPETEV
jgi:hypothetical protein